MPYIGHNPTNAGSFALIDDIASTFNGSNTTFTLQVGNVNITPNAQNTVITLDGVIQHTPESYTISGSTITFTGAPASGTDFYGILMGNSSYVENNSIGADELTVSGDGTSLQTLVSDGDGTFSWLSQSALTPSANLVTGNTLKSTVVTSSLTSVGTLSSLTLGGDLLVPQYIKHVGDTDCHIEFGTDEIKLRTGDSSRLIARDANVEIYPPLVATSATFTGSGDFVRANSNASNANCAFALSNETTLKWSMYNNASNNSWNLYDHAGSANSITITTGGNVGINSVAQVSTGITNFAPKLEVRGGTGTLYSGAGGLILSNADTTILDGDILGVIAFQSPLEANEGDGILASATIRAEADDTFGSTSHRTSLLFATGNDNVPSDAMRIDSNQNTSFNGFISVGGLPIDSNIGINLTSSVVGARFITSSSNANHEAMIVNRSVADGTLIAFQSESSDEGTITVAGSTVAYIGFSGTHESSGIPTNTAIGTVVSTIDELDVYASGSKKGNTRATHAKIKVSDSSGDKRVYGVVQSFNKDDKPMIASVGIGSIKVTGACAGGDLLESRGDGTAKVQSDDIIKSKTIGKVTIGDSNADVKLVSCVLYCG